MDEVCLVLVFERCTAQFISKYVSAVIGTNLVRGFFWEWANYVLFDYIEWRSS